MSAVLFLMTRIFALLVLWYSFRSLVGINEMSFSLMSAKEMMFVALLMLMLFASIYLIIKPQILSQDFAKSEVKSTLGNLDIYHAGMVMTGLVLVFFAVSDLLDFLAYHHFMQVHYGSSGEEVNKELSFNFSHKLVAVVFKNIMAFWVLFGAAGWARVFKKLRYAGT